MGTFERGYEKTGGKVIQEQYTVRHRPAFTFYLPVLKDAGAVAAWFDDADAIQFLAQYHEFGIRKSIPLVAALFGAFFELYLLYAIASETADATISENCALFYTASLETDVNKRFAGAFKENFDLLPEETDSAPYVASQIALRALEAKWVTPRLRNFAEIFSLFQGELSRCPRENRRRWFFIMV